MSTTGAACCGGHEEIVRVLLELYLKATSGTTPTSANTVPNIITLKNKIGTDPVWLAAGW